MHGEEIHDFDAPLQVILVRENQQGFARNVSSYDEWGLLTVEEGKFRYAIGEESGIIQPGQALLCPPRLPLHRQALGPLTFHFARFHLQLHDREGDILAVPPFGKWVYLDTDRIITTLQRIRLAMSDRPTPYLQHLFDDMIFQYIEEQRQLRQAKRTTSGDPRITAVLAHMALHLDEPLSMQHLARQCGWSAASFSRHFNQQVGMSPLRYLTTLRLAKAKSLLLDTGYPLERIAALCGYPSGFYLSRVFRRETGMNPSQYRKLHRV